MIEPEVWEIIEAMERDGGGFVKALAACLRQADPDNYIILRNAFPEYFENYREIARLRKARKSTQKDSAKPL